MLKQDRKSRKIRIRAKLAGTKQRPRLAVFKSARFIYAQLINDDAGVTLGQTSDQKMKEKVTKTESAGKVGQEIAKMAKSKKIKAVVFDRGGFAYHGRIKALAEAARKEGLNF